MKKLLLCTLLLVLVSPSAFGAQRRHRHHLRHHSLHLRHHHHANRHHSV